MLYAMQPPVRVADYMLLDSAVMIGLKWRPEGVREEMMVYWEY